MLAVHILTYRHGEVYLHHGWMFLLIFLTLAVLAGGKG